MDELEPLSSENTPRAHCQPHTQEFCPEQSDLCALNRCHVLQASCVRFPPRALSNTLRGIYVLVGLALSGPQPPMNMESANHAETESSTKHASTEPGHPPLGTANLGPTTAASPGRAHWDARLKLGLLLVTSSQTFSSVAEGCEAWTEMTAGRNGSLKTKKMGNQGETSPCKQSGILLRGRRTLWAFLSPSANAENTDTRVPRASTGPWGQAFLCLGASQTRPRSFSFPGRGREEARASGTP